MKKIWNLIAENMLVTRAKNYLQPNNIIRLVLIVLLAAITGVTSAQAPSLSYSGYGGPENYTVGTAITTLTPTNSGGALAARGTSAVFAGSGVAGFTNGTGILAMFSTPYGLAVDGSGNIYVADEINNQIRKITSAGVVTTLAGSTTAGSSNGTGGAASFTFPTGVCVDGSGNVYVADQGNNMIRKITSAGVVTTVAGSTTAGHADGTGTAATFHSPMGVALDGSGNLFVADASNNEIRKIVLSTGVVTTFAGATTSGSSNGTGTAARFNLPASIAIDGSGNLYVADLSNNMIRKITSSAVVTTFAGSTTAGSSDGTGTAASFSAPNGISLNGSSNIFVADAGNSEVRMITSSGVVTTYDSGFTTPRGIAVNSSGAVYLAETSANIIDKITPYNYSISPALPSGLSFNTSTGAISGTPTATSPSTSYTISAYNVSGTGSVTLNFTIGVLSPSAASLGYIQSETIKISGVVNDTSIYSLSDVQKQTSRVYYDGLGRTVQSVALQASPAQNDLIQPMAYDNLGRPVAGYLPYAGSGADVVGSYRGNALTAGQGQAAFYNQTGQYLIAKDTAAHANTVYEPSPMQRLQKSGMVGDGYQPEDAGTQKYKTVVFRYNKSADGNIPIWNPDGSFTASNYYATSSLSVTDAKDEDGTEALTFTDKSGHLILKRQKLGGTNLDTYYIYNMAGMLSYIVPPQAINLMAGTYSLTATGVPKLIYHYIYDTMGRMTQKTVPAKGTMYIVYDPMNRPVLTQDSNMRVSNKWAFVKYDGKGRVISSGTYTDAAHTTLSGMQTYVSGLSYTTWYETRNTTSGTFYYSNAIFPTTGTSLSYNYYDDYDVYNTGSLPTGYSYSSQGLSNEGSQTTAPIKGMPTVTLRNIVGSGLSSMWLAKVVFFDKRLNAIQVKSTNHVNYTTAFAISDTATMVVDFMGVPQITMVKKRVSATVYTKVQTNLTYDHMYRIKKVDQYYNGSATAIHIDTMMYNELGQVIEKSLGKQTSAWLQNVNYRYNIRGQLTSINNSRLASDTGKTSNDTNDLFGMELYYDKAADATLGNNPYYNGKLSAVKWMSKDAGGTNGYQRAFKYAYDAIGRDTAAIYGERATPTGSYTYGGWNEDRITYDYNGNIKTLYRTAENQTTHGSVMPIDNLTYTYSSSNPNQLTSVADATGNVAGFMAGSGTYTYDGNGNLTNEPYKGLASIAYDVLNKTDKIVFTVSANRYIDYTYDVDGNLLRKRQYDNVGGVAQLQHTTDYVDGFVYGATGAGADTLNYMPTPEGRAIKVGSTFSYEYVITDQQGNVRMTFDNTGTGGTAKAKQENSYYPFGLIMPSSLVALPTTPNKNLYNGGSEWQNDFGNLPDYYQTYFRNYDAALGRWVGVDPMPESAESMSTYQYSGNNPIMFNDPLGNALPTPGSHVPPPPVQENPNVMHNGLVALFEGDIGGGMNNHWNNQGAFDSPGNPFSADGGAAGIAFWAPATNSGGNWNSTWNQILSNSGYSVNSQGYIVSNGLVQTTSLYPVSDARGGIDYTFDSSGNLTGNKVELGVNQNSLTATQNGQTLTMEQTLHLLGYFDDLSTKSLEVGGALDVVAGMDDMGAKAFKDGDQWLGNNGKYNSLDWGGNGSTGSRIGALNTSKILRWGFRATLAVQLVVGAIQIYRGYQQDGGQFGYHSQLALGNVGGAILGGWLGSEIGARAGGLVGGLFGDGAGAVPGAIVGGIAGGVAGSYYGGKLGSGAVDYYYDQK